MKKSFLLLLTSYQGIQYIKYVESRNRWQIKTLSHQSATNSNQGGALEKPRTLNFQLSWNLILRRSRNALIKILQLPIKCWPLLKHWQNRKQIKALVLCSAAEGQPLPFLKSLRSNLTMNHFLIFVNKTSVLLHAHGGV
ncbi:MAG: hypothetical protein RLZZ184_10 [Cyanobacteriota bacterium]